jgi:hypothetical protein
MADASGLWQTGGARSVDQQRSIVDGDPASLRWRQRTCIHSIEECVNPCFFAVTAVNPDFRDSVQMRPRRFEDGSKIVGENDMIGCGDVDTVRQRQPNQFCIDESRDTADFGDAEPGCDVIRPTRHHQANGVSGFNSRR